MTEETINYRIEYDIRGIDRSIHSTQRLLYAMNALRLSIVDIQKLTTDFSLGHLFWAGIQLTRTWTLLYNLVMKTNKAQRAGIATGVARGVTSRATGVMGTNIAMRGLFGEIPQAVGGAGLSTAIMGFAATNPILTAIMVGGIIIGAVGWRQYFIDRKNKTEFEEFQERQREIAKSQGYEY